MNDVPRAPEDTPAVRVAGLSFHYAGGGEALVDVSFTLAAGERVALVGPSGAGKSTLLMHLNGLLPASLPERNGAAGPSPVTVLGRGVTAANAAAVRQSVGFLFQDPDDQLFCPTVREDVAFGPLNLGLGPEEIRARVAESLAAVGLAGFEDRSPLRLSVGERKRVCLAGVLACRPQVLVLDEPSSNLDPRARRELLRNLDRFPGTQLIATHDLDFVVAHCPRVLVLDGGRIRADGPTDRLLRDAALMERHGLEVPLRLQLRHPG